MKAHADLALMAMALSISAAPVDRFGQLPRRPRGSGKPKQVNRGEIPGTFKKRKRKR